PHEENTRVDLARACDRGDRGGGGTGLRLLLAGATDSTRSARPPEARPAAPASTAVRTGQDRVWEIERRKLRRSSTERLAARLPLRCVCRCYPAAAHRSTRERNPRRRAASE